MFLQNFFHDFLEVQGFLKTLIFRFVGTFYNASELNDKQLAMFWTALFPTILLFAFDIVMSFIFSVRSRDLRLFNVLSPKSWRSFNAAAYNNLPAERLKPLTSVNRFSSTFRNVFPPYHYRVNDTFKLKNGYSATYVGCRYIDGLKYYQYRIVGKTYLSPLKPGKFKRIQFNFITNNNTTHVTNYNGSKSGSSKSKPNIDITCDD